MNQLIGLYVVAILILIFTIIYALLILLSPLPPKPTASESTYKTPTSIKPLPLPSLTKTKATVELSVVVPAYNEKNRIGIMLNETIQYLEELNLNPSTDNNELLLRRLPIGVKRGSYEILIIDDGSKDGTSEIALELAKELELKWTEGGNKTMRGVIKIVTLIRNRGKGGSVKHGVLHSAGHRILFADADGASHFPDVSLLLAEMDRLELDQDTETEDEKDWIGGHGVIVGSRAHLVKTVAVVQRSFSRNLLMRLFHTYLYVLGIRSIRDTQCGFKLQSRATAIHIYPYLHSPAWIFDCELLLLSTLSNIPIREIGITWKEVEGSKIDLIRDSINMAIDLLVIRGNYFLGRWKRPDLIRGIKVDSSNVVVDEKVEKSGKKE